MAHKHALRFGMVSALLAGILVTNSVTAFAQAGPATTPEPVPAAQNPPATASVIELVGIVEAIGPATMTVNGQVIDTSLAQVSSGLAAGAPVKVEGTVNDAGQIIAREVRAIDLTQRGLRPGEIELIGLLTAMTQNRLTVAGFPMDAANAEFGPGVGLGQLVKVHVTLNAQNQWVIREIELATSDDLLNSTARPAGEFEITGTLTQVGNGFIVVNGLTISTANAEIKGNLVPGALVKVHLSNVNGQWVAREAELAGNDDNSRDDSRPGEFEIYGIVSEMGNGYVVVNGQRISTAGAEIKGPITIGSFVKVHLSNVNGQWVARELELETGDDRSGSDDNGSDDNSGNSGSDDSGNDDSNDDHSSNSGSDDHGGDDSNDDSGSDDSGGDDDHSGSDHSGDDDDGDEGSDDD